MKTLILTILAFIAVNSFSGDLYVDAYRFSDVNYTSIVGFQTDHFGAEYDIDDGDFTLTNRQYLEFVNIEIGVMFELSDFALSTGRGVNADINANPYIKVGSELFSVLKLDDTNTPVLSVGFKLY